MNVEYRVIWQREGQAGQTSRIHESRESAWAHLRLLSLRGMPWPPLVEGRIQSREVSDWADAS